ncbi:MAG: DUF547 domain-containing protein [Gemmatimonadota bacterium]|uniref:DUF547 domain-containing protein n=1 Tax=Candidatus Palauibacter scopulicola TaxID=3056741 RepID=UPI0023895EA0|nr:DUF547 domain-containing protein [Candidatus Palauibacter scopulicola]MDE2661978.1 DUF547 domain-containing protein [Candidatus Palauibacter scopulicola]
MKGISARVAPWALLGVLALGGISCAGPSTDVAWDEHDPANTARLDHGEWQALLDAYLITDDPSGVTLVDYAKLRANTADRARLAGYIDYLQGLDPRQYAKDVQMAYWINLYNAVTLRVVVDEYPVASIKDIHEGLIPGTGPWRDIHASVAGHPLTLDNIEHDILRPIWRDARIHYGVNCASIGCPNLAPEPYTAENLERLLDQAARDYVNHPRGVTLRDQASAVVSSIYFWYQEDFGDSEAGVLEHLRKYAEGDLAERLRDFDGSLDHDYDWSLNAPDVP